MAAPTSIRYLRPFYWAVEPRILHRTLFTQRIISLSKTHLHPATLGNRNFVTVSTGTVWKFTLWGQQIEVKPKVVIPLGTILTACAYFFCKPSPPSVEKWINWPSKADEVFLGRGEDMDRLSSFFSRKEGEANKTKITALKGMGGIGKTQIALSYADQHEKEYERLIFINCENSEKFQQSLETLKKVLPASSSSPFAQSVRNASNPLAIVTLEGLPQKTLHTVIKESLAPLNKYLLVIDNVDTYELAKEVERILPAQSKGDVILTGQHPLIFEIAEHPLQIKKLSTEAGIAVFRELLSPHCQEQFDKEDAADKKKFIEEDLGGIPLFIRAAAGYFNRYHTEDLTLKVYRSKMSSLNVVFLEALLKGEPPEDLRAAKTAYRTYALHIPEIQAKLGTNAKLIVKDVLYFLGFCGVLEDKKLRSQNTLGELLKCLRACSSNKEAYYFDEDTLHHCLQSILEELEKRYLIVRKNGTIVVHQTTKMMIHYAFLQDEIVKLKDEVAKEVEKNNESYKTSSLASLRYTRPDLFKVQKEYELEKQKMTWFIGAFEYAIATADPASIIGSINYVEKKENGLSKHFRDYFIDILNKRIPLQNSHIHLLLKICDQLSNEDMHTLLITSLKKKGDTSGNVIYDKEQMDCILRMGRYYTSSGIEQKGTHAKPHFQKAEQLFLIVIEGGLIDAHVELGYLYHRESEKYERDLKLEAAKKHYDIYLENKESAPAYHNRSLCYQESEYQKAIDDVQKSIELDPYNLLYYKNLAAIYQKHRIQNRDFFVLYKNLTELQKLPEYQSIDDSDKKMIIRFLRSELIFDCSSIKDGGILFGKILHLNPNLTTIRLHECLSDAGVKSIAESLKTNKSIKEISLHKNVNITSEAIRRLIESVDRGQLERITLTGCPKVKAKEAELWELAKTKRIFLEFDKK